MVLQGEVDILGLMAKPVHYKTPCHQITFKVFILRTSYFIVNQSKSNLLVMKSSLITTLSSKKLNNSKETKCVTSKRKEKTKKDDLLNFRYYDYQH